MKENQRNIVAERIEATWHIDYISVARAVRQERPSLDEMARDSRQFTNNIWRELQEEKYHNKYSIYDEN